jgi:hypothetical protein
VPGVVGVSDRGSGGRDDGPGRRLGCQPERAEQAPHCVGLGVCPEKADVFSGCESRRGKSQTPCSLDGRGKGNQPSEAHRRSHQEDGERVTGP